MAVKVRCWENNFYVVVHRNGRRHTQKCGSEEKAHDFAEYLEAYLKVHGDEALKLLRRNRRPHGFTFKSYSNKWLTETKSTNLKESTLQRYESSLRNHLVPYFGHLGLGQIDYSLMKDFCIKKQPTNSKDGIRLMIAVMRLIMEEAVREDLISKNPAKRLGRFFGTGTKGRGEKTPFSGEELETVLEVIQKKWPEYYEFVLCAARTGMAFGEQRALYWNDIDFDNGKIHVRRSWSYGRPMTTPKTKTRLRKIEMTPQLVSALKALKVYRQEEYLAKGGARIPEWVFLSKEGKPIHAPNFITRVWKPALKEAQVEYRNWHNLRHTFASQLLMAGKNPLYVAQQLGHSKVTTTHDHYAHWIDQSVEEHGVDVLDEGS